MRNNWNRERSERFIIIRDMLSEQFGQTPTSRLAPADFGKYPIGFRLFDDDGELYFLGLAQDTDAVEEAHYWGQMNYGTTYSEIQEKIPGGPWTSFIG